MKKQVHKKNIQKKKKKQVQNTHGSKKKHVLKTTWYV